MRFSANTGFLWKELPFLERIKAAADAGFDAVEFHDEWRDESAADIMAVLEDTGLPVLGLNTRMEETAGCAALPGEQARAREDVARAVEMARAIGAGAVHVMAGKTEADPAALAVYRENLAYAADAADGLTVLIEPLCEAAMPVYPLRTVAGAAAIIAEVGAPNIRIMFDFYHVHQAGDDIAETYARHAALVGHVQIADPVSRNEPATDGEQAIGPLLRSLTNTGCDRPFGCEYRPAGSVEEGLAWREKT